jgi:AcrR family transcriptional regulator
MADLAARLHCSKTTLYRLGSSKEQVTANVVRAFFQEAAAAVERRAAAEGDPAAQLIAYLRAVSEALRPAAPAFIADLAANPATEAVYRRNTELASDRMREIIDEGIAAGGFRAANGAFVADLVAAEMRRIQTG